MKCRFISKEEIKNRDKRIQRLKI